MPVSSNESGGSESTFETEEDEKENDEELDVALVNLKQRRGRCRPLCTFQMSVQYIRALDRKVLLPLSSLWSRVLPGQALRPFSGIEGLETVKKGHHKRSASSIRVAVHASWKNNLHCVGASAGGRTCCCDAIFF